MREEGIHSILVNPNVATIQTDTRSADKVYLLPVNPQYVESVIEKERPDALVLSFGGQTALNCGVSLDDAGILSKYGIKVLGTQVDGIRNKDMPTLQRCNGPNDAVHQVSPFAITRLDKLCHGAKSLC